MLYLYSYLKERCSFYAFWLSASLLRPVLERCCFQRRWEWDGNIPDIPDISCCSCFGGIGLQFNTFFVLGIVYIHSQVVFSLYQKNNFHHLTLQLPWNDGSVLASSCPRFCKQQWVVALQVLLSRMVKGQRWALLASSVWQMIDHIKM